ncbi:natural killer cell receptor 2B4 [Lepus europaeus]|uniref:natural killer cell receptor 2B4 n=1 Tax=Lepus europaeus TaxID=9983 RepID=UPI002B481B1E|nr:natural killer cell receptor 2B4 [Lepus europaeus]
MGAVQALHSSRQPARALELPPRLSAPLPHRSRCLPALLQPHFDQGVDRPFLGIPKEHTEVCGSSGPSGSGSLDLHIKASEPQDSGFYVLGITYESGHVCEVKFNVSVFDHVKKPHIQEEWKALGKGICQMTLSCLVIMDEHVNYTWYRGSELLQVGRNLTYVEQRSDTDGVNTYTCNVSNRASWASHTLNITQGCSSAHQGSKFLPFLVAIMILTMLFLGTLTFFCMWRRKRRQSSETSPKELLTIYEDVKDLQIRRNQEQEQKPPEGSTIYSMIQAQTPASASSETSNTLYSLVHKSGSKVKNHNPSISHSVYEEVGKRPPKAQNPTRLSREELESFDIYS